MEYAVIKWRGHFDKDIYIRLAGLIGEQASPRRLVITTTCSIMAVVVAFCAVYIPTELRYRTALDKSQHVDVNAAITSHGAALAASINGRISLLDGFVAEARSEPTVAQFEREYPEVAAELVKADKGLRSVGYVTDDNRYFAVWKDTPRHHVVQNSTDRSAQPSVLIATTQPQTLCQFEEPNRIVAQRALFNAGKHVGTAWIVLNAKVIYHQAKLRSRMGNYRFALRDVNGKTIYGDDRIFRLHPVVDEGVLGSQGWLIAGVPDGGWEAPIRGDIATFRLGGMFVLILLLALVTQAVIRQSMLIRAVSVRTAELAHVNDELHDKVTEREDIERVLRASEQFRSKILATVPTGVIVTDAISGNVVEANEAALKILGMERNSLVGRSCAQCICGAAGGRCPMSDHDAVLVNREMVIERADGAPMVVLRTVVSTVFAGRRYVIESVTDFTAQKELQRELRSSRELYRSLLDTSPDYVFHLDKDENTVYANPLCQERIETFQKSSPEHAHQQYMPEIIASIQPNEIKKVLRTGELLCVERGEMVDGAMRWMDNRLVPIKDANGEVSSILGLCRDISERKQAEQAQQRLVDIMDATPDFVVIADMSGRMLYINPAVRKIAGITNEQDCTGKPISWLHPAFDAKRLLTLANTISKHNHVWIGETVVMDRTRRQYPASVVLVAHREQDGSATHFSVIIRDLNKLKRAEEKLREMNRHLEERVHDRTATIEQLLTHKDNMLNQLSHDLKTPLTPLMALLPLVRNTHTTNKGCEMLDVCIRNVDYMNDLVRKTLDLCRLDAPTPWVQPVNVGLHDEIMHTLEDGVLQTVHPRVNVVNDVTDDIYVAVDPLRLREVFYNLFDNACRYMPDGGTLAISAARSLDMITVTVRDTGTGIPVSSLNRIFDEFYKVDASRHDRKTAGLGLSICKRIVELHGGRIWAESEGIGTGAAFNFTLPEYKGNVRKTDRRACA